MFLYALNHLVGYDAWTMDEIKGYGSAKLNGYTTLCHAHPEIEEPAVEVTTGPLGQGIANSVGLAIASKNLAALYNRSCFDEGPLVNKAAVDKVKEHIDNTASKGAKVKLGSKAPEKEGFFFEPTVLSGVTTEILVSREETFGPLAHIFKFDSENKVLRLANKTKVGLAGYFFSQDIARAMRVAQKLQCGMVGVNTGKISAAEAPFGGVKESGYGKEGSLYGLEEYQIIKSVTIGNQNVGL